MRRLLSVPKTGRCCAIPKCPSGGRADRARRSRVGLRQMALFSIPKRNNALQKWSEAVGRNLAATDFICELHFSDDSIIKEDKTLLFDGTMHSIPRTTFLLKEGAAPKAIGNGINGPIALEIVEEHNIEESAGCQVNRGGPENRELDRDLEGSENHAEDDVILRKANEIICIRDAVVGFADHLMDCTSTSSNDHEEDPNDEDNISEDAGGLADHSLESSSANSFTDNWENADYDFNPNVFGNYQTDNGVDDSSLFSNSDGSVNSHYDLHYDETDYEERNVEDHTFFTIDEVFEHLKHKPLPESWCWVKNRKEEASVVFVHIDDETLKRRLHLVLHGDLSVTARTPDDRVGAELQGIVSSVEKINTLLTDASGQLVCCGSGLTEDSRAETYTGLIKLGEYKNFVQDPRCTPCRQLRKKLIHRSNRRKTNPKVRYARSRHQSNLKQRRCRRLKNKVELLKRQITDARKQCADVGENALNDAISSLTLVQQESVRACFSAAKVKYSNQRRYTLDWVYECLLMRIKSSKLYDHLRSRNILPLPCKDTLSRYIQQLDSRFGFQKSLFNLLRFKASRMETANKRGTLLVDEMSLSETVSFDRKTLKFSGFVDLGEHTPGDQHNVRGDHSLVFMYQPFRGPWVQVLGCFLSKNSVTSKVLHKLILECILLLEDTGFHVDVVTMDGAQWNRGVWSIFGIKDGNFSCEHPCDGERRLWMSSDFPHLMKCFRNAIMQLLQFWTPNGTVRKEHWEALLEYEGYTKPNMSAAYILTLAHINPKGYQKMNVPLAFQLFSERVRVAMELFKNDEKCPALNDAEPTIHFIRLIDNLIHAMMSRTPLDALRTSDTCKQRKAIEEFLKYLRDWEASAKAQRLAFPISPSTVVGLKVTLGSTLEVLQFLHDEHNYDYLMTARLNQDALERFFGMMRNACGSNDHPDPVLFSQVFRLLCSYSLVKPPKGSNVCGSELLQTLMQTKESMVARENPKKRFFDKLDALVEAGQFDEPEDTTPAGLVERDHLYSDAQSASSQGHLAMHDYDVVTTSEEVQAYIAGYVARKVIRFTKCNNCVDRLKSTDRCNRDRMIDLMNRYDGLIYSSEDLFKLTKTLEKAVLEVVGTLTVKENTLQQILEKVSEVKNLTLVGCIDHEKEVTKKVINFYLVMRATFLADSINKNCDAKKFNSKMHRKNAKL